MPDITVDKFKGLDLVGPRIRKDMKSLREARNVDLTESGLLQSRDGTELVAELHPESVGLFKANGQLHALVPAGSKAYKQFQPYNVIYDPIGDSASDDFPDRAFDASGELIEGMKRVADFVEYGIDEDSAGIPYVVVELANGQFIHHYIDTPADTPFNQPVVTRVALDFLPGPDIEKLQGKIYATDRKDGVVQFCSTLRPRDWTTPEDSGFLPVNQEAGGERRVTGLAQHNGDLVVTFPDTTQIWNVNADPEANFLQQTLFGPGTRASNTLRTVKGDVFYFSEGGFNSLRTQAVLGELRPDGEGAGDIGAPIQPLTRQETDLDTATALWSEARGQYLCSFNRANGTSRVYAFKNLPTFKLFGWTYWDLPFTVDYMVELNGFLNIRTGNKVYRFNPACDVDAATGEKVQWKWRTHMYATKHMSFMKRWQSFDSIHEGKGRYDFIVDDLMPDEDIEPGPFLINDTLFNGIVPIVDVGPAIGLQVSGEGAFKQETFTINYKVLSKGSR